jgi:hypothetical protein
VTEVDAGLQQLLDSYLVSQCFPFALLRPVGSCGPGFLVSGQGRTLGPTRRVVSGWCLVLGRTRSIVARGDLCLCAKSASFRCPFRCRGCGPVLPSPTSGGPAPSWNPGRGGYDGRLVL